METIQEETVRGVLVLVSGKIHHDGLMTGSNLVQQLRNLLEIAIMPVLFQNVTDLRCEWGQETNKHYTMLIAESQETVNLTKYRLVCMITALEAQVRSMVPLKL